MRKACLEIDTSNKKAKLLRCECTARGTKKYYFIKRYLARLYPTTKHQFDSHFLVRSESTILYHVEFFFGHLDCESVIGQTNVIRKRYIGGLVIEIMRHMHQERATRPQLID
jgi:hypothetical protein